MGIEFRNSPAAAKDVATDAEMEDQEHISYDEIEKLRSQISHKDYVDMLKQPLPGSIIATFKNRTMRNKRSAETWFKKHFLKKILVLFMSPKTSIPIYVFLRLVMPHALAIETAEDLTKQMDEFSLDEWDLISRMSGEEIKDRSVLDYY